jgi:hypothetical protein
MGERRKRSGGKKERVEKMKKQEKKEREHGKTKNKKSANLFPYFVIY